MSLRFMLYLGNPRVYEVSDAKQMFARQSTAVPETERVAT